MGLAFSPSDLRFRAVTVGTGASMIFDFTPPSCSVMVEYLVPFSVPAETDIPSAGLDVVWRIDDGRLFNLKGLTGKVAMGDAQYVLYMYSFENFDAVLAALENGAVLRMRETVNSVPYYFSFQMNGLASAFRRAQSACAAYTTPKPASKQHRKKTPQPSAPPDAKIL